jgi:hypothetical protein
MGKQKPTGSQKIHGMYRIPHIDGQQEDKEKGKKEIRARAGITFVLLWKTPSPCVFMIDDRDTKKFVLGIPPEAELVVEQFNRDGSVPSGVCDYLRQMLKIQEMRIPTTSSRTKKTCSCEACSQKAR